MAIYRLLESSYFDPERVEKVAKAFEDIVRTLRIDRAEPVTELIAKKVFRIAQTGESDPDRLREKILAELGVIVPAREAAELTPELGVMRNRARSTVLIVEDDAIFAYTASRYFESLGYTTVVASGSFMAFRELDRQPVNAVIADVRLNGGEPHGIALGRMIRNRDPEMPVLLVTAYPDLAEKEKPLPGLVFSKPVELRQLASALGSALAR
jgi:CheY-like chemotaxis protein